MPSKLSSDTSSQVGSLSSRHNARSLTLEPPDEFQNKIRTNAYRSTDQNAADKQRLRKDNIESQLSNDLSPPNMADALSPE